MKKNEVVSLNRNSRFFIFYILFLIFLFVGCERQQSGQKVANIKEPLLLSVDFKPDVPLVYKFVSERQIMIDLAPSADQKGKDAKQNASEKLELEAAYKPLEVNPYGLTVVEATCKAAKVSRTGGSSGRRQGRADAAEGAAGKSWTLTITPTGKITDLSSFEKVVQELGELAFAGSQQGRVKDPDMLMDFIATQQHIWNSISSVPEPLKGVKKGQEWNSKLLAPMPFVSKTGRDVKYRFADVVESNGVSYAKIVSSYNLSDAAPADVKMPYTGSFNMRGTFGFLRGYRIRSIEGSGEQLYDIERGVIVSDVQRYKAKANASIFGLGDGTIEPSIEIDQTITMTLQ